jgi:pantoate kinase
LTIQTGQPDQVVQDIHNLKQLQVITKLTDQVRLITEVQVKEVLREPTELLLLQQGRQATVQVVLLPKVVEAATEAVAEPEAVEAVTEVADRLTQVVQEAPVAQVQEEDQVLHHRDADNL